MLKIQKIIILLLFGISSFYCDPASPSKKSNSADQLIPLALLGSLAAFSDEIPYATCENSPEFSLTKPIVEDISEYTIKFYRYTALDDETTNFSLSSVKGETSAYTCVFAFQENMIIDTESDVNTLASGQSTSSCQTYTSASSKKGAFRCVAVLGATTGKFSLTATSTPPTTNTSNPNSPVYNKIFTTAAATTGNLGGLSGADIKCNIDNLVPYVTTYPAPYYKAMLYGNDALKPNTTYSNYANSLLGKTDESGNLPAILSNSLSYNTNSVWTGDATNNCVLWTSAIGSGQSGLSNSTTLTYLSNSALSCNTDTNRIYCVQQPASGTGPTISNFSPTSGSPNATITITGNGFSSVPADNIVVFNGVKANVSTSTNNQIVVSIPNNITFPPYSSAVNFYVVTNNQLAKPNSFPYSYTVTTPAITSASPSSGFVGTSVKIIGANFTYGIPGTSVLFNGIPATVTSSGPNGIFTIVPAGATSGTLSVTNSNGTGISLFPFIVMNPNYTPTYNFTNGLPAGWTGTNGWTISTTACPTSGSGNCLQSAVIDHSASSTIQFTANTGSGNIIFKRKVSSESSFDTCVFKIDGISPEGNGLSGEQDLVSSFPVTSGPHIFSWTYSKDRSIASGTDSCAIDDVFVP